MNKKRLGTTALASIVILLAMYSTVAVSAATILYSIDFSSMANGSEPANWYHDPSFSVQNGLYTSTGSTGYQVAYYTGQTFGDATYTVQATGLTSSCLDASGNTVPCSGSSVQYPPVLAIAFKMQDKIDGYWFWGDIDKIQIVKWVNGEATVLADKGVGQINPMGTFTLTVTTSGNTITANWNGQFTITATDSQYSSGYAGVGTYHMNSGYNDLVVSSGTPMSSSSASTSSSSSASTSTSSSVSTSGTQTTTTRTVTTTVTSTVTSVTTASSISTTTVTQSQGQQTVTENCQVILVENNGQIVSEQITSCT